MSKGNSSRGLRKFTRLGLTSKSKSSVKEIETISNYFKKSQSQTTVDENYSLNISVEKEVTESEIKIEDVATYSSPSAFESSSSDFKDDFNSVKTECKWLLSKKEPRGAKKTKTAKERKLKQTTLKRTISDNFSGNDVDAEQLQMALALSKSTYESESCVKDYDEDVTNCLSPYPSTQQKISNIKKTLEQFGFTSDKSKLEVANPRISDPNKIPTKRKKSKFKFITPTLYIRTEEEREALILSKVSSILQQCSNSNLASIEPVQPKVTSTNLSRIQNLGKTIFSINNSENFIDKRSFYVKSLDISQSESRCGCLLKDWTKIPGRDMSPVKDLKNRVDETPTSAQKIHGTESEGRTTKSDGTVSPDLFDSEDDDGGCPSKSEYVKSDDVTRKLRDHHTGLSKAIECFDLTERSDDEVEKMGISEEEIVTKENDRELLPFSCSSNNVDQYELNEITTHSTSTFEKENSSTPLYSKNNHFEQPNTYPTVSSNLSRVKKRNLLKEVDDDLTNIYETEENLECEDGNRKYSLQIEKNKSTPLLSVSNNDISTPSGKNNPEISTEVYDLTLSDDDNEIQSETLLNEIEPKDRVLEKTESTSNFNTENSNFNMEIDLTLSDEEDQYTSMKKKKIVTPAKKKYSFESDSECEQNIQSNPITNFKRIESVANNDGIPVSGKNDSQMEIDDLTLIDDISKSTPNIQYCVNTSNILGTQTKNAIQQPEVKNKKAFRFKPIKSFSDAPKSKSVNFRKSKSFTSSSILNNDNSIVEALYFDTKEASIHRSEDNLLLDQSLDEDNLNVTDYLKKLLDKDRYSFDQKFNQMEENSSDCLEDEELNYSSMQPQDHYDNNIENPEEIIDVELKIENKMPPLDHYNTNIENAEEIIEVEEENEKGKPQIEEVAKTPLNKFLIKSTNVTPMPDYDSMNTPNIRKELEKFGLKPAKRNKGVQMLKYIYHSTHPFLERTEILEETSEDEERILKKSRTDYMAKSKKKIGPELGS